MKNVLVYTALLISSVTLLCYAQISLMAHRYISHRESRSRLT
jgi:hypothetical protein